MTKFVLFTSNSVMRAIGDKSIIDKSIETWKTRI